LRRFLFILTFLGSIWVSANAQVNITEAPGNAGNPYATLSAAITAASPGNHITVDAATVNQTTPITINKNNLTITGISEASSIISYTGAPAPGSNFVTITGSGVTLENLTFNGNDNIRWGIKASSIGGNTTTLGSSNDITLNHL